MKKTGAEKFVGYINTHLEKPLLTTSISNRTKVSLRRVQVFCKRVRESNPRIVKWMLSPSKGKTRSIRYTFTRAITQSDIK